MAPPFAKLTLQQFVERLSGFSFSRRVGAVHMHHTWRPNHANFKKAADKHSIIVSMWRFHTDPPPKGRGFSDIAQHITIDPQGNVWLGRDWNLPPASATGHNGSKALGPFMFEMIGDFDREKDPFVDPQKNCALTVVAAVQKRFGLPVESLRFHNQMASKTCPGSSIAYQKTLEEVRSVAAKLDAAGPVWWTAIVPFSGTIHAAAEVQPAAFASMPSAGLEDGELPEEKTARRKAAKRVGKKRKSSAERKGRRTRRKKS